MTDACTLDQGELCYLYFKWFRAEIKAWSTARVTHIFSYTDTGNETSLTSSIKEKMNLRSQQQLIFEKMKLTVDINTTRAYETNVLHKHWAECLQSNFKDIRCISNETQLIRKKVRKCIESQIISKNHKLDCSY